MLDVAPRGIGDHWNDVILPGFDYCVVENTLGKVGMHCFKEPLMNSPIHRLADKV